MPALVQARVATGRIGANHILLEAIANVFGVAFEHDEHTEANVVADRLAVALKRRDHLHLTLLIENAALSTRSADRRDFIDRRGWIGETVRRRGEARCIAHGRAFDRRLRSVQTRIEHFRIESADTGLLGRQAVMAPHRFRRRLREMRQPLVAASGSDHAETRGWSPNARL